MRPKSILLAAGEGALAGLAAAATLVGWEIYLNRYLQQDLHFLILLRSTALGLPGAVAGASFSTLAAAVLAALRGRGRPATFVGAALLGLLGVAVAICVVVFWRKPIFPPATPHSIGSATAAAVGISVAAIGIVLLWIRSRDALRHVGAPRTHARRLLAAVGLAGMLLAVAARAIVPALAAERARGHPSVIFVSIDTLRADRLGALGNPRRLTPHLDRIAAEGAVFLQATATSPWTLPSHASVFSSMLPFDHAGRGYHLPVKPQRSMLAERFRDAGYRTAAFTGGGWVEGDRGFYQGFEIYECHDEIKAGGPQRYLDAAARWVQGLGERPFFLFVHTYEPHTPFVHADFADARDRGRVGDSFDYTDLNAVRSGELVLTAAERRFVVDLYDGDVAQADRLIGGFLERLREVGGLRDAIVVIFSDHGEDLWDHVALRSPDHGHSLYEELLRVPLIVWAPGRVPPGTRVAAPVSLLAVAPTTLALAELPRDPEHRGRDLAPILRNGLEPPPRLIFAESVEYGPDRFSARDGNLKAIFTPFPERFNRDVALEVEPLEVFDLASDPREQHGLALDADGSVPAIVRLLQERAERTLGFRADEERPPLDLPKELQEQLRALGYVN